METSKLSDRPLKSRDSNGIKGEKKEKVNSNKDPHSATAMMQ